MNLIKKTKYKSARDKDRDLIFSVGDRVHWFEYSNDMIIINGGYGIIVEIEKVEYENSDWLDRFFLLVLKDGSTSISVFPINDCDQEEIWEE